MNLLEGGSIVFYYDYARYFGLTGGMLAVPFMWVLGFNTMAFNLPATLFFSLYLWTLYLIAREIVPGMALLVLMLMLISPPFVTQMTTHNWPHIASAFFGNLIFLLFIKAKLSEKYRGDIIFFLFFSMGLAIYTYTFSLIYISVVAILHALSHPQWNQLRQRFDLASLAGWFKGQKTKGKAFVQILDVVIVLFLMVIIFSYVFGGFGLDIAGVSIFQVNNFHKPVFQMLAILILRILIYRKDLVSYLMSAKTFISEEIPREARVFVGIGGVGFLLGLSPRIASILIGETTRGGQGFDVDFNPIQLI
ncbi:glycosyltransferase family 39 protein, partial [bacterium AH-315-C08]|nr:glycosyltransferase family 39 protein [bacterium AH-315-C08]